ncbi:hypothetical protein Dip510_001823 [Elusimicrobium posterum]|uniref:SEL1-like repeat protein n=1 Tax=Elusimicrobium posterum TaxID=3116653 RepID=UPI003C78441F
MKKLFIFIFIFISIFLVIFFAVDQREKNYISKLVTAAKAGDIDAALQLSEIYDTGTKDIKPDNEKYMYWLEEAANLGDAYAQGIAAMEYYKGELTEQDYDKAFHLATLAAGQGDDMGQDILADCYRNARGTEQDIKKAIYWYNLAAGQDNPFAMESLGFVLSGDYEGVADYKKAVIFLEKAAEYEMPDAIARLGYLYYKGEGVVKDEKKAIEYFEQAAELGDIYSMNFLGEIYYYGENDTPKNMELAFKYFSQAYEEGSDRNVNKLASMYEYGEGIAKDQEKAADLYAWNAERGNSHAQSMLAYFYTIKNGPRRYDLITALYWYEAAAAQDNAYAMAEIADIYLNSDLSELPNKENLKPEELKLYYEKEALNFLTPAVEKENAFALYLLGNMYYEGLGGLEKDYKKAASLFEKSAGLENSYAQKKLAQMYESGTGVKQDKDKALYWYKKYTEEN